MESERNTRLVGDRDDVGNAARASRHSAWWYHYIRLPWHMRIVGHRAIVKHEASRESHRGLSPYVWSSTSTPILTTNYDDPTRTQRHLWRGICKSICYTGPRSLILPAANTVFSWKEGGEHRAVREP